MARMARTAVLTLVVWLLLVVGLAVLASRPAGSTMLGPLSARAIAPTSAATVPPDHMLAR